MAGRIAALVTALLALGLASVAGARTTADPPAATEPVPSLTPVATKRSGTSSSRIPSRRRSPRTQACAPVRVIVYAATDWLRVATKLAASPSPCAQYYVSIPPLAGNKSQPRADQAWRIRALGPAFHALAEINVTGWTIVGLDHREHAGTRPGVEARRRMAAAGYDVAAGDTWALNEISSAVRQGTGSRAANMRDFLDGLYDGDGVLPASRGVVWVIGFAQAAADISDYQSRLQDWYGDQQFWTAMARDVSDWQQEVFGDVRKYAVPGASREARRDALNEYLQHPAALAAAAPADLTAAKAFDRLDVRPARERRLAVGRELRLHARPLRPDAGLRHGAGLRGALRRPTAASASRGSRTTWTGLSTSRLQRPDRRDPRAARRRDRGLVRVARGRVRHRLVQPRASTARASRRSGAASRPGSARPARTRRRRETTLVSGPTGVVASTTASFAVHRRRDRLRLRVLARRRALHAVRVADRLHRARGRAAPLRGARRRSVGQRRSDARRRPTGRSSPPTRAARIPRRRPTPARAPTCPAFTAPGTRIPPPGH